MNSFGYIFTEKNCCYQQPKTKDFRQVLANRKIVFMGDSTTRELLGKTCPIHHPTTDCSRIQYIPNSEPVNRGLVNVIRANLWRKLVGADVVVFGSCAHDFKSCAASDYRFSCRAAKVRPLS